MAKFDGGQLSSDGGGLLLREVDRRTGMLAEFAACFRDYRSAAMVEHSVSSLIRQRVMGLALGYEDLNDHDQLRHDPLIATLVEKSDPTQALAGKSTLNRLELSEDGQGEDRYKKIVYDQAKIDRFFVNAFLKAHTEPPNGSFSIWIRPTTRFMVARKASSFMATTVRTVISRSTSFAASFCCALG